MRHLAAAAASVVALGVLSAASVVAAQGSEQGSALAGQAIAQRQCAGCHAIGVQGESPLPAAPPFRVLGQRYPVDALEEALAEGILTGHPSMPEFRFTPEQITDLVAYLKSVQTSTNASASGRPAPKPRL